MPHFSKSSYLLDLFLLRWTKRLGLNSGVISFLILFRFSIFLLLYSRFLFKNLSGFNSLLSNLLLLELALKSFIFSISSSSNFFFNWSIVIFFLLSLSRPSLYNFVGLIFLFFLYFWSKFAIILESSKNCLSIDDFVLGCFFF